MDTIIHSIQELDFRTLLLSGGILILALILLGAIARLIFGKRSLLGCSVSSAIAILFIYALVVVLHCAGEVFQSLYVPLPFVTIDDSALHIHGFSGGFSAICAELVSMITLSLIVNLIDTWMPRGKKLTWILFRVLTVVAGLVLHIIVVTVLHKYLSGGLFSYTPAVILGILLLLMVSAILKVVLITTNPIIGLLYAFFFANIVGKQVFKAVLTTALLSGLLLLLQAFGILTIFIAPGGLIAYLPFALALIGFWYVSNKFF